MSVIKNPILPGFHPDPDIIRVKDDYYITTTTFEWFPGINIHHSKDLANWKLIGHALDDRHLNGSAFPDSGGNYIPSIAYKNGIFYIVYTEVYKENWPNVANRTYLITTKDIRGPWSDPIYLNSISFDSSIFIDTDNRIYILNLIMETRVGKGPQMKGFMLQEYDEKKQKLVGSYKTIFQTDDWNLHPEGGHIYHIGGYYYLMCAIHGTQWNHATLFLRSKNLWGPYEVDHHSPTLTSAGSPPKTLQKAGQGCLVDTPTGEWFLAHHASRPVPNTQNSPLGRETCLQKITWDPENWPRLVSDSQNKFPLAKVDCSLPETEAMNPSAEIEFFDDFSTATIKKEWNTLRECAHNNWIHIDPTSNKLRIRGRQPIGSIFQNSLLATRWKSLQFSAETKLSFAPQHYRQSAGLIAYYDSSDYAFAYISFDEKKGETLHFIQRISNLPMHECPQSETPIVIPKDSNAIRLRLTVKLESMQFEYAFEGSNSWKKLSKELSTLHLSDEGPNGNRQRFTGAFVGLAATDCLYENLWADYDYFKIEPMEI